MELAGTIIQGICGWSDPSIVQCKRFYPPRCTSSIEKLSYLSRTKLFGTVEIDSSTYAIPSPETVERWVGATPKSFIFHMKAFGLLCNGRVDIKNLPGEIREMCSSSSSSSSSSVSLKMLGELGRQRLWQLFNASVDPIFRSGKLGCILFQFQLGFLPNQDSYDHISYCRQMLSAHYPMAIEFRERAWTNDQNLTNTVEFLSTLQNSCALVASDDLHSEMYPNTLSTGVSSNSRGSSSSGLGKLHGNDHLPIVLTARCNPNFAYVRIHRRSGHQRVLSDEEIAGWIERINQVKQEQQSDGQHALKGPVYVLWGTDHEDQPIINAKKLRAGCDGGGEMHVGGIANYFSAGGSVSKAQSNASNASSSSSSSSFSTSTSINRVNSPSAVQQVSSSSSSSTSSSTTTTLKRKISEINGKVASITSFFAPAAGNKKPKDS